MEKHDTNNNTYEWETGNAARCAIYSSTDDKGDVLDLHHTQLLAELVLQSLSDNAVHGVTRTQGGLANRKKLMSTYSVQSNTTGEG